MLGRLGVTLKGAADDAAQTQVFMLCKIAEGFGIGKAGAESKLDRRAHPSNIPAPLNSGVHCGSGAIGLLAHEAEHPPQADYERNTIGSVRRG